MNAYSGFKKLKIRYLWVLLSLFLLAMIAAQPTATQAAGSISGFHNVSLWVYPEYDDSRLLVMLEGKIAASEVPSQISFLVPQTAEMYSAGSKDAQGNYSGGPPTRAASQIAGWDEISYQLKTDTFRVEYYDNIITGTADKKIAYDFRWLYPITDLRVIVQQPLKASNFAVIPSGTAGSEDQFSVYTYNFTNPDINKPLHFDISYTKTDPNPSLGNTAANSSPTISTGSLTLIVIAALVVVAVIVFFTVNRMKKKKPARVNARPRMAAKTATSAKDKFCDQCGQPVGKQFKFCPHCGNDLG